MADIGVSLALELVPSIIEAVAGIGFKGAEHAFNYGNKNGQAPQINHHYNYYGNSTSAGYPMQTSQYLYQRQMTTMMFWSIQQMIVCFDTDININSVMAYLLIYIRVVFMIWIELLWFRLLFFSQGALFTSAPIVWYVKINTLYAMKTDFESSIMSRNEAEMKL